MDILATVDQTIAGVAAALPNEHRLRYRIAPERSRTDALAFGWLLRRADALGYRVRMVNLGRDGGRAYHDGRIEIAGDMSPGVSFAILAHELAHQTLHWRVRAETPKPVRETEAELSAAVLCALRGVTPYNHADYIALHGGTPALVRAARFSVYDAVSSLIA